MNVGITRHADYAHIIIASVMMYAERKDTKTENSKIIDINKYRNDKGE